MSVIEPRGVLDRLQVASVEGIYGLGCQERRVTIYAQQVRALNLVWALNELKELRVGARVVIIGAGAAGLTAALGFARKGADIHVVERNEGRFQVPSATGE